MASNESTLSFLTFMTGVLVGVILAAVIFLIVGSNSDLISRQSVVDAGAAEWTTNPKTGEKKFVYLTSQSEEME